MDKLQNYVFKFLNKKEFNFGDYIIESGYTETVITDNHTRYTNGTYFIDVFKKASGGYSLVTISSNFEDFSLATFRFIPNSKVMTDMILSNIQAVFDETNETAQ